MRKLRLYVNNELEVIWLHTAIWEKYKNLDLENVKESTPVKIKKENSEYLAESTDDYNLEKARVLASKIF